MVFGLSSHLYQHQMMKFHRCPHTLSSHEETPGTQKLVLTGFYRGWADINAQVNRTMHTHMSPHRHTEMTTDRDWFDVVTFEVLSLQTKYVEQPWEKRGLFIDITQLISYHLTCVYKSSTIFSHSVT